MTKASAAQLRYREKRRRDALAYLGNRCEICGEADRMVLELDHRDGGGSRERRAGLQGPQLCKQVTDGKRPDIRCLCRCCNFRARILGPDIAVITIPIEVAQEIDPLTYKMSKEEVWRRIRSME